VSKRQEIKNNRNIQQKTAYINKQKFYVLQHVFVNYTNNIRQNILKMNHTSSKNRPINQLTTNTYKRCLKTQRTETGQKKRHKKAV